MNSEVWLRMQYQTVIKERDDLQHRFDQLEKENQDLRRCVYELSYQLSQQTPYNLFRLDRLDHWKPIDTSHEGREMSGQQSVMPSGDDNREVVYETDIRGHTGAVYAVDITRDGKWIASGSFDRNIYIWEGSFPYKQVASLTGHARLVTGVAWSLDTPQSNSSAPSKEWSQRPLLYSSSFDKTVRVWDTDLCVCLCVVRLKAFGTGLICCPPSLVYTSGCAVATTSAAYLYIVGRPAAPARVEGGDTETHTLDPVMASVGHTSQAVFHRHTAVPTAVVTWGVSGSSLLVGDAAGVVTWYEIVAGEVGESQPPVVVCRQSLEDERAQVRILSLQLCGRSIDEMHTASAGASSGARKVQSRKPSIRHGPQSLILAAQCSDDTIRLYEVMEDWPDSEPETGFLLPLRLLRGHSSSGQWPIRMSFLRGNDYSLHVPRASRPTPFAPYGPGSRDASGRGPGSMGGLKSSSSGVVTQRVKAKGLPSSQSSVSPLPRAVGDDASIESSVGSVDGRTGRRVGRGSDEDDAIVSITSASAHGEEEREDDDDDDNDDDDDGSGGYSDGEGNLSMAAGIVSARLLRDKGKKDGDADELLASVVGMPPPKAQLKANEWNNSLILATGSNTGQVFLYDISSINKELDCANDDSAMILSSWKVLEARANSEKVYGALFLDSKASLLTYGSDNAFRVWSLVGIK